MQTGKGVENLRHWRERRRRGGTRLAAAVFIILILTVFALAQQTKFDDMPIAQVAVTTRGPTT